MNPKIDKARWKELLLKAVTEPGAVQEAYSRFWNYSVGNQLLALFQCCARNIDPGPIATYRGWHFLGRHVIKGQKALSLVMPITVGKKSKETSQPEETEDDQVRTVFVVRKNWFVLSQTDGETYNPPPIPDWNKDQALQVLEITEEPFQQVDGNIQGWASKQSISVSPVAALPHKTRFHEIAHILLGHTKGGALTDGEHIPRSLREAEAESVALICCESLGLPGGEFSRSYIQNWLDGGDIPERSAQRIFSAADRILKAGVKPDSEERRHQ